MFLYKTISDIFQWLILLPRCEHQPFKDLKMFYKKEKEIWLV